MKKRFLMLPLLFGLVLSGCKFFDIFNGGGETHEDDTHEDDTQDEEDILPNEAVPKTYTSNGVDIREYKIVISNNINSVTNYASSELQTYFKKSLGYDLEIITDSTSEQEHEIILGECNRTKVSNIDFASLGEESFIIKNIDDDLIIAANKKRGLLYGVYSFLEALGYRFFTPTCERIPESKDVFVPNSIDLSWTPKMDMRETMFKCAWDPAFAVKQKINHDFQRSDLKNTLKYGGYTGYIGGGKYLVHTFKHLLPYNTYYSAHPDWYSSNVGSAYSGAENRQPCFSNYDSIETLLANIDSLIATDPNSKILSLSQNDGGAFCQCSKCIEAEKIYGKSGVMLLYINKVAKAIKEKYPDIKVDTLAYNWSIEAPKGGVKAEDNVIIRFCSEMCPFHDDDHKCEKLIQREQYFLDWQDCANEFSVWTYPITWGNLYNSWPNYYQLKDNIEFYYKHGVKAIYQEGFAEDSCEFAELKAYVLAKLAAKPTMSDEEYEYHICDFLRGYYGAGWKHVRDYIKYANRSILNKIKEKGCLDTHAGQEDLFDFKWDKKTQKYDMEFINKMNSCWNNAMDAVSKDSDEFAHVEKSSLHWVFIELFCTFEKRYLAADEFEAAELVERNKNLYQNLKKYNAIYKYDNCTINLYITDFTSSPQYW